MRNLLLNLFLLIGLKQILARSLPWDRRNTNVGNWWNDYDYDLFGFPSNHYNEDFHKFLTGENFEDSNEITTPTTNHNEDEINSFLGAIVGSFLLEDNSVRQTSDETKDKNKSSDKNEHSDEDKVDNSNEDEKSAIVGSFLLEDNSVRQTSDETKDKNKSSNENEHSDEDKVDNSNEDEKSNQFDILLYNPVNNVYETKDFKSSEDNNNEVEKESKSSEENFIIKEDKSEEDSNEMTTKQNDIEINDLTKSSEEIKDVNISENDIKELTTFLITLSAIEDIMNIANKNSENEVNDELKSKEVDEYLSLFGSVLDKILEDELNSKENKDDDDDNKNENNSNEVEQDRNVKIPAAINESDEDDDNSLMTTTSKNDSSEENNDNSDDQNNNNKDSTDDSSASDSKENKFDFVSVVFHGFDNNNQQKNLNDHKYEIIELSQEFKPTTAPYMAERASSSSLHEHNVIQEYVEIRENIDHQQDTLQKNELSLDKDFYTIISNNYDNESMSKFEKDIYAVHENLDRIRRNINAMQNLHSKLYFHKLITAAVKDAQNKSK